MASGDDGRSMSMVASPNPKVTLRVNDQGGGPVIYARFRRDATHAELALGRGWLVPSESELAKPKGKVIGGWVERRGRPTDGALSVDRAWQSVPDVIGRYLRKAEVEAHQRMDDARPRLGDAVERWLAARKVDDPSGEREAWKHSHAKNMTNYAHRFVRELGPDRHVDTFRTAELRRWLAQDLKPMRNGAVMGQPTSRKMRSTYAQALAGFFAYAVTQAGRTRIRPRICRRIEHVGSDLMTRYVGTSTSRSLSFVALSRSCVAQIRFVLQEVDRGGPVLSESRMPSSS
jgi:hypothetical protein